MKKVFEFYKKYDILLKNGEKTIEIICKIERKKGHGSK